MARGVISEVPVLATSCAGGGGEIQRSDFLKVTPLRRKEKLKCCGAVKPSRQGAFPALRRVLEGFLWEPTSLSLVCVKRLLELVLLNLGLCDGNPGVTQQVGIRGSLP